MLVDYLLAITTVTVLKKSQIVLLLFYRVQVGLFSPMVGLNVATLHILFMSGIWSICVEFIILNRWLLTVTNTCFDHQHSTQKHDKVR
jgi:hypothetical protein